ncbi:DUF4893 domain-containing protein [Paracoccus caeni]|uniref:DUF4893 domain-containing protein n=1 Tax=Paracoccus caeni TaxID=657651 RepID=A0A934VUD1_9RHOB|nr:DUF4893 domain-containing protein [Paracoccus caeni]MBK4215686.1 DUF4893 domain-containing protein [Paracoccus caeni]
MPMNKLLTAIALSLLALPALAEDIPIRTDDAERLAQLDATTGEALRQAFAGATAEEAQTIARALTGEALPAGVALELMPGEWSCRMAKLGGLLPVVIYQPFRCVFRKDGTFEKLTGSQRTIGSAQADGERLLYLGTGFIAGDTPPGYADLPEDIDATASPQRFPEIGVIELTGPDSGRILFPAPHVESRLNILILSR